MPSSVTKWRLKNGLTVVAEKNKHFKTVSVGLWIKAGSRQDYPRKQGLAHAVEHMVFKETKHLNQIQIATFLERVGGELNAFTERELTCFYGFCLSRDLDLALKILSEIGFLARFTFKDWKNERKVLAQEWANSLESPEEQLSDCFFSQLWGDHPLSHAISGDKKSLARIQLDDVKKFYFQYYAPKNMVLSVVGNFSLGHLKQSVSHFFTKKVTASNEKLIETNPPSFSSFVRFRKWPTPQVYFLLGYQAPSFFKKNKILALVLSQYFTGGMSSQLFQEIREKRGLVYSLDTEYLGYSDGGVFCFSFSTSQKAFAKSLEVLRDEIKKVTTKPMSLKKLNFLKNQLIGTLRMAQDSLESAQEVNARNEIWFQRYYSTARVITEIKKVKPNELLRFAKDLFLSQSKSALVLSDKKPKALEKVYGNYFS